VDEGCGGERPVIHSRSAFYCSPLFFHRIILLLCAIAISVPVLYKSRPGREHPAPAAFTVTSSSRGFVRISGDVRHAGVYPLSVNTVTMDAIKMADPQLAAVTELADGDAVAYLENGMDLHVTIRPNGTVLLTKKQMAVNDRIVMGVPLDINTMSAVDFDRVPGIGPKMADRIVEYRQNNGGTMKVADLLSIEGIGEKKYKHLLKFF
jgi:competence protein ComEA